MRPGKSALDLFSHLISNGFTFDSDPVWNYTILGWYQACVNQTQFSQNRARMDPIQMEPNHADLM